MPWYSINNRIIKYLAGVYSALKKETRSQNNIFGIVSVDDNPVYLLSFRIA
jgi:hypothetical protein